MLRDCFESWNYGKPNQVFPFLLEQADQGDLEQSRRNMRIRNIQSSVKPLTKHLETAPPTGSRHRRPIERAGLELP